MEDAGGVNNMDNSYVPNGSDPENIFRILVKIEGFLNNQDDGRKVYVKGKLLKWNVNSNRFSLCDLISELALNISWGSHQKPKIWMFDKNEGRNVELVLESQITTMFSMYEMEKKIELLVVVCNLDRNVHEESQPDQFEGTHEYAGVDEEYLYDSDLDRGNMQEEVHIDLQMDNVHEDDVHLRDYTNGDSIIAYDHQNPKIELNALFPDVKTFRKGLRHFAIQKEFEIITVKSDKTIFIGKCKQSNCPWRIHASRLQNDRTFMIKRLPHEHTCPSTTMVEGKMASKSWIEERAGPLLQKNPSVGAKEVKARLEDEYHVKVSYDKAWKGRKAALERIRGTWEESFQALYNFKAELDRRCPGSIVEIDPKKIGNKMHFSRMFVALKPCIDGFLNGCRPYVAVDSTHLTGKYKGQLVAVVGIDGHTWLYPVAYGVFDKETTENWKWFMEQLKKAIGSPPGLAISSDAGKGLSTAIASLFPESEHRECMNHLNDNFKKKFHGDVFAENMWPAANAYTTDKCQAHLKKIGDKSPEAIQYLEKHHKQLWCRSKFSKVSKVDYNTNSIAESFNSWIKNLKDLHVVDLVDGIRQMIMLMFDRRKNVACKLEGLGVDIIPNVMKQLNAKSRNAGKPSINRCGDNYAKVCGMVPNGNSYRHMVELDKHECTCGEWQLTGRPCAHAVLFICSLRGARMEDYVHEYYSLQKFRNAYAGIVSALPDKSRWVVNSPGFKVYPPIMEGLPAGRPKKQRIPGVLELTKKRHKCKRCGQLGHQERTCKAPILDDSQDVPETVRKTSKKRKRVTKKI